MRKERSYDSLSLDLLTEKSKNTSSIFTDSNSNIFKNSERARKIVFNEAET